MTDMPDWEDRGEMVEDFVNGNDEGEPNWDEQWSDDETAFD